LPILRCNLAPPFASYGTEVAPFSLQRQDKGYMTYKPKRLNAKDGLDLFLRGIPLLRSDTLEAKWHLIDTPVFPVGATFISGLMFITPRFWGGMVTDCDCVSHTINDVTSDAAFSFVYWIGATIWAHLILFAWCLVTIKGSQLFQPVTSNALMKIRRIVYFAAYPQVVMSLGWGMWSYTISHMRCYPTSSILMTIIAMAAFAAWFAVAFARIAVIFRAVRLESKTRLHAAIVSLGAFDAWLVILYLLRLVCEVA